MGFGVQGFVGLWVCRELQGFTGVLKEKGKGKGRIKKKKEKSEKKKKIQKKEKRRKEKKRKRGLNGKPPIRLNIF